MEVEKYGFLYEIELQCRNEQKRRRYVLSVYNQIILGLNQQQSGRFRTEAVGQHIQESIEEIGRHMYQEI